MNQARPRLGSGAHSTVRSVWTLPREGLSPCSRSGPRPRWWWALDCTSGRQPSAVTSPCGLSQGPHGASVVSHCPLEMVLWGGLPRHCGNLRFQVTPRIGKGRGPFLSGGEEVSLLWARQADPPPLLVSPPWVTTPVGAADPQASRPRGPCSRALGPGASFSHGGPLLWGAFCHAHQPQAPGGPASRMHLDGPSSWHLAWVCVCPARGSDSGSSLSVCRTDRLYSDRVRSA